jgi:UDP-N-acetylglucosamine 2-epimerase
MEAIKDLGMQTIVLYPNSDAGSKDMIHVIHEYEHIKFIQIYKNIHHDDFQDLMMLCDVIIGNSSCGLLEAPSFNLPAVNIGERQKGRGHTFNIINSDHNKDMIVKAVQHALTKEIKEKVKTLISPYAKKNAEENIIKILKEINYHESLKAKFCEKN